MVIKRALRRELVVCGRRALSEEYRSQGHSLLPFLFTYGFGSDNVAYVVMEPSTRELIAVDTGDFESSERMVQQIEHKFGARLKYILSTHHHHDHVGANLQWKLSRPEVHLLAGSHAQGLIPGQTTHLDHLQITCVGQLSICCLHTPGHTHEHVSYVVTHVAPHSTKIPFLFPGDTLFIGGCGRLFTGTAEQLYQSLQTLAALPAETLVFPAHEYTEANLRFALALEPDNEAI